METRSAARKSSDSYNCGLLCLDELGRLTQPGQYNSQTIANTASSTNGFTAADLVRIGKSASLRLHAAMTSDLTNLPLPSIVHLRSEHFVVVREHRGAFYGVSDPVIGAPRWLLAGELANEATGCVIVSDAIPPQTSVALTPLDSSAAAGYRGRIPGGGDHDDGCDCCSDDGGCCGAPVAFVSEYLNLWVKDTPLQYKAAYGPEVSLRLAYTDRRVGSVVSGAYWHGAQLGNLAAGTTDGLWGCSWLSFAELDSSENVVELMLPASGWATFTFSGGTTSDMNYKHNLTLKKTFLTSTS